MKGYVGSLTVSVALVLAGGCSGGGGDPEPAGPTDTAAAATSATGSTSATEAPAAAPIDVPEGCPAPATEIELLVSGTHWADERGRALDPGEACLVAPAGEPFTVTLDNRAEGLSFNHNLVVYADPERSEEVFSGDLSYPGDRTTYELPDLEAAAYLFVCNIHPENMTGVLVVE